MDFRFIKHRCSRSYLSEFDELLLVNLCQTDLALLVVQSQTLLVLEHVLLRFLFAHHVIKHLQGQRHTTTTQQAEASLLVTAQGGDYGLQERG